MLLDGMGGRLHEAQGVLVEILGVDGQVERAEEFAADVADGGRGAAQVMQRRAVVFRGDDVDGPFLDDAKAHAVGAEGGLVAAAARHAVGHVFQVLAPGRGVQHESGRIHQGNDAFGEVDGKHELVHEVLGAFHQVPVLGGGAGERRGVDGAKRHGVARQMPAAAAFPRGADHGAHGGRVHGVAGLEAPPLQGDGCHAFFGQGGIKGLFHRLVSWRCGLPGPACGRVVW